MSGLRVRLVGVTCVTTWFGAASKHFATVACADRLIVDTLDSFAAIFVDARFVCTWVCGCVCVDGLRALLDGRSRCQKWSKSPWLSAGR